MRTAAALLGCSMLAFMKKNLAAINVAREELPRTGALLRLDDDAIKRRGSQQAAMHLLQVAYSPADIFALPAPPIGRRVKIRGYIGGHEHPSGLAVIGDSSKIADRQGPEIFPAVSRIGRAVETFPAGDPKTALGRDKNL